MKSLRRFEACPDSFMPDASEPDLRSQGIRLPLRELLTLAVGHPRPATKRQPVGTILISDDERDFNHALTQRVA